MAVFWVGDLERSRLHGCIMETYKSIQSLGAAFM